MLIFHCLAISEKWELGQNFPSIVSVDIRGTISEGALFPGDHPPSFDLFRLRAATRRSPKNDITLSAR